MFFDIAHALRGRLALPLTMEPQQASKRAYQTLPDVLFNGTQKFVSTSRSEEALSHPNQHRFEFPFAL